MPDYKVAVEGSDPFPVRAINQTAAMRFAIRKKVTVSLLTTEDAIEFGRLGINLIDAGDKEQAAQEGSLSKNEEPAKAGK